MFIYNTVIHYGQRLCRGAVIVMYCSIVPLTVVYTVAWVIEESFEFCVCTNKWFSLSLLACLLFSLDLNCS